MGFAEFIEKRFLGEEICVYMGDEAETITYEQSWAANKSYFRGTVEEIDEGILILNIPDNGLVYINCEEIQTVWEPSLDYHKSIRTSLTKRMVGARGKDK